MCPVEKIDSFNIIISPDERTANDPTIDERIRNTYFDKGYDKEPTTKDEARSQGKTFFNGLENSITGFSVKDGIAQGTARPTRYLIGKAYRDYVEKNPDHDLESIDMLNVSLLAPVEIDGEIYLISQIKGLAEGQGQIHAALSAGGVKKVNAEQSLEENLYNAVKDECKTEVGHDDTGSKFMYYIRDNMGYLNFGAVMKNANLEKILSDFNQNEEVTDLVLTKIGPDSNTDDIYRIIKTESNEYRLEKMEDIGTRPYTEEICAYMKDKDNLNELLIASGLR